VYFTYGMHFCMNLVCEPPGVPSAVLLRAGELVKGADLVAARRGGAAFRELARGPARLTVALGVSGNDNGRDACDPASPLRIRAGAVPDPDAIRSGPRVGVAAAADVAWRFWLDGEQSVSAYRRHAPRRRPASPSTRAESDTQGFRA
jgi:DNA-3-methyladenine glycosylase